MKLVSPLEEVVEVVDQTLREFTEANDLEYYKLMKLIEGFYSTNNYLGWKVYDRCDKVISPSGEVLTILGSKKQFAKDHNITPAGLTILTKNKRAYRGWQPVE